MANHVRMRTVRDVLPMNEQVGVHYGCLGVWSGQHVCAHAASGDGMSAPALAVAMMLGHASMGPVDTGATPQAAAFETPSPPRVLVQAAPAAAVASAEEGDINDITVTAHRPGHAPGDPLQEVNVRTFAAMQAVDRAFVGPVAHGYEHTVPRPARDGLRNFFRNLHEPIAALNFVLQLKPGRAAKTVGRFALNSTVGGAGLFDMARRRPFNMPFQANGFANTLAYYGVGPGPFIMLPVIGATTLRDLVGRSMDTVVYPFPGGRPISGPAYAASSTTVKALNKRIDFDGVLQDLPRDNNRLAYATYRERFMARRAMEVAALHSRPRRGEKGAIELVGPVTVPALPIP